MSAIHEHRVSKLAHRIGLRLVCSDAESHEPRFRLVEPTSMTPVYPGGADDGSPLDDLEDWLQLPWE
jgi:hypothetical protein